MEIEIVPDEMCPTCGRGEPDFHNRPKVHDGEVWWWRCYNPDCNTRYYVPETGETEAEPTPEQEKAQAEATQKYLDSIDWANLKVTTYHADGTVTTRRGA